MYIHIHTYIIYNVSVSRKALSLNYSTCVFWSDLHHRVPAGQPVFSAQHCASADHQAEGDSSGRVQSLHEGSESHPHPGASAGDSVRAAALQTWGACLLWNIRLHHAHIDALPGGERKYVFLPLLRHLSFFYSFLLFRIFSFFSCFFF